jgi:hypothetical protein
MSWIEANVRLADVMSRSQRRVDGPEAKVLIENGEALGAIAGHGR